MPITLSLLKELIHRSSAYSVDGDRMTDFRVIDLGAHELYDTTAPETVILECFVDCYQHDRMRPDYTFTLEHLLQAAINPINPTSLDVWDGEEDHVIEFIRQEFIDLQELDEALQATTARQQQERATTEPHVP